MRNAFPAVVTCLSLVVSGAEAAARSGAEGLLLYASFDGEGYQSLKPRVKLIKRRANPVMGKPGHYPVAEFARGNPLPHNLIGVEYDKNGRFGGAARVPALKGVLTFDADGNILTRRGTLAVWVRPEEPLWSTYYRDGRHPSVFVVRDLQNALRISYFMRVGVNSRRKSLYMLSIDAQREGVGHHGWEQLEKGTRLEWRPGNRWPVREWRHIAVVWDAARGRKWYFNGKQIAGRWGAPPEHRPPGLDQISLGCNAGPAHLRAQDLGFSFDELYVFDYVLTDEQIRRLIVKNEPPAMRNPLHEDDQAATLQWTRSRYGLDQPREGVDAKDIPEVRDGVLRLRRVPIGRMHELLTETRAAADGMTNTVWPLEYKSPSTDKARRLVMPMIGSEPINYIRICGPIQGELFADGKPMVRFLGDAFVLRKRLTEPATASVVTLQHEFGRVNEIAFYNVTRVEDRPLPNAREFSLSPGSLEAGTDLAKAIRAHCLPEDRSVLLGEPKGSRARSELAVKPCVAYQVVTSPFDADTRIGQLMLDLELIGFDSPTHLMIDVHDVVTFARKHIELEVRVLPTEAASRRVRLLFDGPAIMVAKGQRLWLTLRFDQPGRVGCGAGGSGIVIGKADAAQEEAWRTAMNRILCDRFLQMSEPQPWNAAPGEDPVQQYKGVRILFAMAQHMMRFDPGNRAASALLSWTLRWRHKWSKEAAARYRDPYADMALESPEASGPAWAVHGREALKIMRKHVDWWVGHQDENGELGSGINDDTDMIPEVVNFSLISDPGGRLKNALRKLADLCWRTRLTDGINTRLTDHLHAFEEGINIQPPLTLLFYGNPEYVERLMITSRAYETHLTGINPQGDRLFRSLFFSATALRKDLHLDPGWCLVMSPGRYLVWYNGNPGVLKVLSEWYESWRKRMPSETPGYLYGSPGKMSIDFKTGEFVRGGGQSGMPAHIYWLYRMTGDRRYVEPILDLWRAGKKSFPIPWVYWAQWREVMSDERIDARLRKKGARKVGASFAWKLGIGERSAVIDQLKGSTLFMKKYLPVTTWVGQSADRVKIPQSLMATMYLGGMADKAKRLNYHYHAVSWEGADDDVSRFVVDDSPSRLKVLIYSFHDTPQDIVMRVWGLDHGRYRVRWGLDTDGDEKIDSALVDQEMELMRYTPIALRIPSKRVVVVTVEQEKRLDVIRHRADLAIGPADVTYRDGELRVTVHNIGGSAAPAGVVELVHKGAMLQSTSFGPIEAPVDLGPRTATVEFAGVSAGKGLVVRVKPPTGTREITSVNNEVAFRTPREVRRED